MVVIRLARAGSKKKPFYHIVATTKSSPRDGKFLERLGYYNPVARGNATKLALELDRINYWVGNGAQLSTRAKTLVEMYKKEAA